MKTKYIVIIAIVLVLIGIRISLPFVVIKYVNKVLSEIPGYRGQISDVHLNLFRGAYVIDSLVIEKIEGEQPVPFFSATKIDLSVHWGAIFQGSIVGEIGLLEPKINFVDAKDTVSSQYGDDVDWTKSIKDLMPLTINLFTVDRGEIHFHNFSSKPPVDVYLRDIQLEVTNMSNASNQGDTLPAHFHLTANSLGDGQLSVVGDMNIVKKTPDFDLDLKFEDVDLTALNDFLMAYAKVDAERGVFHLYAELIALDGQLDGYVKPLLIDLKITDWDDDKSGLQKIWEGIVGTVLEIFENQSKDQFATKLPFNGTLDNPDTGLLPAIWNIFSNAFVEAFSKSTDNVIDFNASDDGKKERDKKK